MHRERERPFVVDTLVDVIDEDRIDIDRVHAADFLQHDRQRKRITAPHFENARSSREHLGHELVARKHKEQPARVGMPIAVLLDAQPGEPAGFLQLDVGFVLRLIGPRL